MRLSFSLDDTAVTKKLRQMSVDIKDFTEPFTRAGDELLTFFGEDVFAGQGRPVGESWRALAASTLKAREERTGHYAAAPETQGKILWWTGALKRGFRKNVDKFTLRISNEVDYFQYHQKRGGKPPQRKMLGLTADVILKVMRHLQDYMKKIV